MPRHCRRTKKKPWTIAEIEQLKYIQKSCRDVKCIVAMFPYRSEESVKSAMYRYCGIVPGEKDIDGICRQHRRKEYNPNPPTMLTYILVHNYYDEDIRRGMTHDEAINDIADTLNRSQRWVKQALKTDVRKYVETDEKKDYEEMELRHTYIR